MASGQVKHLVSIVGRGPLWWAQIFPWLGLARVALSA
jgi:hypothetical protein